MAAISWNRRTFLGLAALAPSFAGLGIREALAAVDRLRFDELYSGVSPLGLTLSDKTKALTGQPVRMLGYMAPPLKAEAKFFVLTEIPMSLCPFCNSDTDWPDYIVVTYLREAQTFVQANKLIEVAGRLDVGSWTDPETGFVSLVRIVDAEFSVT